LAGLSKIHDIDLRLLNSEAEPVSQIAVLARVEVGKIGTSDSLGTASGRLRLSDGSGQTHLLALSAAEVYFQPPPEGSTPVQRASLFSPFWQARLIKPTEAHRAAAATYVR
jgi:hypothetical protein